MGGGCRHVYFLADVGNHRFWALHFDFGGGLNRRTRLRRQRQRPVFP